MRMSSQSIRWRTLWASVSTLDSRDEDVPPEADKLIDLENKKGMLDSVSSNSLCDSDHRPIFINGLQTFRGECPEAAGCHHHPLNEHSDSVIMCDGEGKLAEAELSEPEDVLSGVADVLLTRVLSFLPAKTVIRTSVLSSRWSPLWATVPCLTLSLSDFLPRGEDLYSQMRRNANLMAFVQRFLRRNSPCYIESLKLFCLAGELELPMEVSAVVLVWSHAYKNRPVYPEETSWIRWSDLESWTRLAEGFKVPRLAIFCGEDMVLSHQLRPDLFRLENLVVLELMGLMVLDIPLASVSFPKLEVLRLDNLNFEDNYSASNLINSCCPKLEKLFVSIVGGINDLHSLAITAQTLRRLELEFVGVDSASTDSGTRIDAPGLQYLSLRSVLVTENEVAEVWGALDEAVLDDVSSGEDLFWLLARIQNVKKLTMSEYTLVSIDSCTIPTFNRLTCLETEEGGDAVSWEVFVEVLKKTPILEDLQLKELSFDPESVPDRISEHDVPRCLTTSVKNIEINPIKGDEDEDEELEIVGYFLKHSQVLEKMKVVINGSSKRKREIKEAILALPKGSPECDVVVTYTA